MKKFAVVFQSVFLTALLVLTSCSTPTPKLGNLSTTAINLSGKVGETKSTTVTFTNTGDAALSYTASVSPSDVLEITQGATNTSVTPKQSATLTVEATCLSLTPVNGTLNLSSTGGNATINITLTCTGPTTSGNYTIDLRFIGDTTTRQQKAAFEQAALRWEAVITGDLTDIPVSTLPAGPYCDPNEPDISSETIDDLLIFAQVGPIDGEGNTLAKAGPVLAVRSNDGTTFIGCMIFDSADIDTLVKGGSFTDVVTHEMGHVLGIGTLWEMQGLLDYAPTSSQGCSSVSTFTVLPTFTGQNAIKNALGALENGNVPVEDEFGEGTKCGHWDEGVFDNELMTGFAEAPGVSMPLSKLTIGSLEDIGYSVDYTQNDTYTLPSCRPTCSALKEAGSADGILLQEQLLYPKFVVDAQGNLQPIKTR
jgi:Leishmanolysin